MKYSVFSGYMLQREQQFADFASALACLIEHNDEQPCRARLLGEGYDNEQDGLTGDEREAVELAEARAA